MSRTTFSTFALAVMLVMPLAAHAQQPTWNINAAAGNVDVAAKAIDPCTLLFTVDDPNPVNLNPLAISMSDVVVVDLACPPDFRSWGSGYARFYVAGLGTQLVRIHWVAKTRSFFYGEPCTPFGDVHGLADLTASIGLFVDNPPAGTFDIWSQWKIIDNNNYRPESPNPDLTDPLCLPFLLPVIAAPPNPFGADDPSFLTTTLDLNGVSLINPPGFFDLEFVRGIINPGEQNDVLTMNAGDTLTIDIDVNSRCEINEHGRRITLFGGAQRWIDESNTNIRGSLYLSLTGAIPPGGPGAIVGCPGLGDCFTVNGSPSCNEINCCQLVCAQDTYCCDVDWDIGCVTLASQICPPIFQPPPSCPSPGPCHLAHADVGCDDVNCCTTVCAIDSFCCSVEWDPSCADAVVQLGLSCLSALANDDCANALAIGDGTTMYTNVGATTDGPADACPSASFTGVDDQDVWFEYVASCDGTVTIDIQPTNAHQLVAVYDGTCPQAGGAQLGCVLADPTVTSSMSFAVAAGQSFIIRIGSPPGFPPTDGTMTITCAPAPPPCGLCPMNLSMDAGNVVNAADLALLLGAWSVPPGSPGSPGCGGVIPCCADLNTDGVINAADLALVLGAWSVPPGTPTAACP